MEIHKECIKCITCVRLDEAIKAIRDEEKSIEIQRKLLEKIAETLEYEKELTRIATRVFLWLIETAPEVTEYYKRIRRESIRLAKQAVARFLEANPLGTSYEDFRTAVKISIAGNLLDICVHGHTPPSVISIREAADKELGIDHTREIYEYLRSGGKTVVWLFDNAGESVYDTMLIDIIRRMGSKVIGVAKEDPGPQNDLTITDLYEEKLDEHLDEAISTGYPGLSIHLDKIDPQLKKIIAESDLVIAKGMAHYEYLSTISLGTPIAHLLVAKCRPVASKLGVNKGDYVALLRK